MGGFVIGGAVDVVENRRWQAPFGERLEIMEVVAVPQAHFFRSLSTSSKREPAAGFLQLMAEGLAQFVRSEIPQRLLFGSMLSGDE
jgi:hypothetical protein